MRLADLPERPGTLAGRVGGEADPVPEEGARRVVLKGLPVDAERAAALRRL